MPDDLLSPGDLVFDSQVFEIGFHPNRNIIACGLISGEVHIYDYGIESSNLLLTLRHHKKSCRALQFSSDGMMLYTGSGDKSLQALDMTTGKVIACIDHAHSSKINAMLQFEENMLSTGDDGGCVKIWDTRQASSVMQFHENEDFISDFAYHSAKKCLLSPSGDGTLSVLNLRKKQLFARSDNQEDELLSVVLMKEGKRVVCGTQDGIIDIFTWDRFGDISDRYPGHPHSIDSIVKINDDLIATASSDGLIRVVNIQPNKFVGVIGEHEDFPVERIRLSQDGRFLASCSHDQRVKFWNMDIFFEADGDEDGEESELNANTSILNSSTLPKNSPSLNENEQWEDEENKSSDNEDDSEGSINDSDIEDDLKRVQQKLTLNGNRGQISKQNTRRNKKKSKGKNKVDESFFDGM